MSEFKNWGEWDRKKVFIILKNNFEYSGQVVDINDAAKPIVWISLIDKYGNLVTFTADEIKVIEEKKDG